MSLTSKPSFSFSVDQVIGLVEQLSPKDKLKVARAIRKEQRDADVDRMAEIFSKVRISPAELTRIVEEERAKIHARESRKARR